MLSSACLAPQPLAGKPRAGTDRYHLVVGDARSVGGCDYRYRQFVPDAVDKLSTVIIGHGFLRNQATMASLAGSLAEAGFRSITLDFCNMRPWNAHHRRNAGDMLALSTQLAIEHPIYAGFSAGGLAALLAAVADPKAVGVLLLDPVDQDGLGVSAVNELQVPVEALFGEPSACNAFQQARSVVSDAGISRLSRIEGASHCEFEAPSNWLCELLCGDGQENAGADRRQRDEIIEQAGMAADRLEQCLEMIADQPGATAVREAGREHLRFRMSYHQRPLAILR